MALLSGVRWRERWWCRWILAGTVCEPDAELDNECNDICSSRLSTSLSRWSSSSSSATSTSSLVGLHGTGTADPVLFDPGLWSTADTLDALYPHSTGTVGRWQTDRLSCIIDAKNVEIKILKTLKTRQTSE